MSGSGVFVLFLADAALKAAVLLQCCCRIEGQVGFGESGICQ
jgi:hypothetical protein